MKPTKAEGLQGTCGGLWRSFGEERKQEVGDLSHVLGPSEEHKGSWGCFWSVLSSLQG